jgi:SAM-dependent methyltransferase
MDEVAHTSKNTTPNRYPAVFSALRKALCWEGKTKKILSIGCGTGEEVRTMRELFPESFVHGYDLDHEAIKEAQQTNEEYPDVDYFNRKQDLCEDYDLVLCLSVACRYPHSKQFPYTQFYRLMCDIDRRVAQNGFLAIYNAQYDFSACDLSDGYVPIDVGRHDSGTVPKFTPLGDQLGPEFWVPILFKKCPPYSVVPQLLVEPAGPVQEPPPWKPWRFEDLVVAPVPPVTQSIALVDLPVIPFAAPTQAGEEKSDEQIAANEKEPEEQLAKKPEDQSAPKKKKGSSKKK